MWEIKKDSSSLDRHKWTTTIVVAVGADETTVTHDSDGAPMSAKRLFLEQARRTMTVRPKQCGGPAEG